MFVRGHRPEQPRHRCQHHADQRPRRVREQVGAVGDVHRPGEEEVVEVCHGPGGPRREPHLLRRVAAHARQGGRGRARTTRRHRQREPAGRLKRAMAPRWKPTACAARPMGLRGVAGAAEGSSAGATESAGSAGSASSSMSPGGWDVPSVGCSDTSIPLVTAAERTAGSHSHRDCGGGAVRLPMIVAVPARRRCVVVGAGLPACARHGRWRGGGGRWWCWRPPHRGPRVAGSKGDARIFRLGVPRSPLCRDGARGPRPLAGPGRPLPVGHCSTRPAR